MEQPAFEPVETMDLTAGEPCLDFVNTGSRLVQRFAGLEGEALEAAGPFGDRLRSYADLVTFAERTGVVDAELGRRLRVRSSADEAGSAAVLAGARALREAMFRVFVRGDESAITAAAEPASAVVVEEAEIAAQDLALLHGVAAAAAARQQLVRTADGYALQWPAEPDLERVLWPLATAAVSLLVSADAGRVKECAGHDCNWLFLDSSRNRSRRWCDMKACGNRAKARQYYHRHQGG